MNTNKPLEILSLISCNSETLENYLSKNSPELFSKYQKLDVPSIQLRDFNAIADYVTNQLLTLKPFPDFNNISTQELPPGLTKYFIMKTYISLKYSEYQDISRIKAGLAGTAGKRNGFSIQFAASTFPLFLGMKGNSNNYNNILFQSQNNSLDSVIPVKDILNNSKDYANYRKELLCPNELYDFVQILYNISTNNPLIPTTIQTESFENSNATTEKRIKTAKNKYSSSPFFPENFFSNEAVNILNEIGYFDSERQILYGVNYPNADMAIENGKKELRFAREFIKKIKELFSQYDTNEIEEQNKMIEYNYISEYCFKFQQIKKLTGEYVLYKNTQNEGAFLEFFYKLCLIPDPYTQNILQDLFIKKYADCQDSDLTSLIDDFNIDIEKLKKWYYLSDVLFYLILTKVYTYPLSSEQISLKQCNIEFPNFDTNKNMERYLKNNYFYKYIHQFYFRWRLIFVNSNYDVHQHLKKISDDSAVHDK